MSTELDVYERLISDRKTHYRQDTRPNDKGKYGYTHIKQPITDKLLSESITSQKYTLGACTIESGSNLVRSPSFDIDNHDGTANIIPDIKMLCDASLKAGYHPFIEASSGDDVNDGAHIIFICKPTLAATVRKALQAILDATGLKLEINPKQDTVNPDKFGNQVKLIWQFHNRTKKRSTIINPETMQAFERSDAIKYLMALPDTVFSDEPAVLPVPVKVAEPIVIIKPISSLDYLLSRIKPCIKACYDEKWPLHGKGDEGHNFRIFVAGNMAYNGASDEQVHEFFKIQIDYSEKATNTQLKSIKDYLAQNKKPMGCKTLMAKCLGLLNGMCNTCTQKPKERKSRSSSIEIETLSESEPIYTDMRNSKRLAARIQDNAKYNTSSKAWMIFSGKIWEYDTKGVMLRYAREVVRELQKEALGIDDLDRRKDAVYNALKCESLPRLKSMVELCQSEEGVCIDANCFDENKMLLNVQNGTLDLNTGKLLPHNPLDFITKISPVTYDLKAKCPRFMEFLDEALLYGDDEMEMKDRIIHRDNIIAYLKRHSGYSMTGNIKEEQFLILYGDGGHGKSKYVGALAYVMGTYHDKVDIATIQESVKTKDGSSPTPDLVKLKGLRFISTSEPEKGLRLNESRIKDFTGREEITGRGLHEKPITFLPEFKLCIYTNYQIIIRGQDKSIWRRVHQVGFDCEPKNIDMDLDLKLKAEASGILNWMLEGCLEWNKTGLAVPKEITDAIEDYKDDMDVLSGFLELCCIYDKKDRNLKGLAKELFHVYQAWWQVDNPGNAPYFDRQFYQALHERGYKRVGKYSRNGLLVKGVKVCEDVREAYKSAITISGGYNGEAVKLVKQFLVNFVPTPRMEKKPDNSFTTLTPSQNEPIDNENKKNTKLIEVNLPSHSPQSGTVNEFSSLSQLDLVKRVRSHLQIVYGSERPTQAGIQQMVDQLYADTNQPKERLYAAFQEVLK